MQQDAKGESSAQSAQRRENDVLASMSRFNFTLKLTAMHTGDGFTKVLRRYTEAK